MFESSWPQKFIWFEMQPLPPSVALVANGEIISPIKTQSLLSIYKEIVAVDGGLQHCDKMGIVPSLIIGDLDSASDETLKKYAQVPIIKFPKEKDESDLELAIQEMLRKGVEKMALFGVLGKRVDHLLYTLYLLTRYRSNLVIQSEEETIFCLQKQNLVSAFPGQTISLIPLTQASGISTEGLKCELHEATFDKRFMSLSNICLKNSFKINIQSGDLVCFMQKKN